MKLYVKFVFLLVGLLFLSIPVLWFYSYVFSKNVEGEIVSVERAGSSTFAVDRQVAFSFAVAIKDKVSGEIVTASSEDRQWAVAKSGLCAKATYFPYPPWELDKAGTYFGARLLNLYDCGGK